jgi:phospholipase C
MRSFDQVVLSVLLSLLTFTAFATSQISSFQHVVLVVQENRTPDNMFYALCTSSPCSTKPTKTQYDIQTSNWLDKEESGGIIQPTSTLLNGGYNLTHSYHGFNEQCDFDATTGACKMDGDSSPQCSGCAFQYVDNSTGTITPYIQMVQQYGWANYMFQTNQGQSLPAHQFLFGATSAASASDDAAGIFVSGNETKDSKGIGGCQSEAGAYVFEVTPPNDETLKIFPCFEHNTLPDVVPSGITWKYYTSSSSDWNAPEAINHICQPTEPTGGTCAGTEYLDDVDTNPKDFLADIGNCKFQSLTWVIPTGDNSDHGGKTQTGGPSWVASIVNAVGQSACKNSDGSSYWNTTAVLVTWDDWGGWYDHEPPTILAQPEGDYQYGFRVPLIFVSAYTPAGFIDNGRHDFGSIARFVEQNFGVKPGILGFADARATDELSTFFNLKNVPRPFVMIPSVWHAEHFISDQKSPEDPDDY